MTWDVRSTAGPDGTETYRVASSAGSLLTRAQALLLMRESAPFRSFFLRTLADAPFEAFFWETPPTTRAHQARELEWALVSSPALATIQADASDFQDRFDASPDAAALAFPNLGGDAMLVVPAPRGPHEHYAHLAAFVRHAPAAQADALVRKLAAAIEARLSAAPLWVSTAGLGVSWLHLRLDSRPKYYRHEPYKRAP
jgi:hypothetical protein